MEYTITEQEPTRALLVEADTGDYDAQATLDELFDLLSSAGFRSVSVDFEPEHRWLCASASR